MRCLRGAFSKQILKGVEQLVGLKFHDWPKMLPVINWHLNRISRIIISLPKSH
jgi:hypothetical protein